MFGLPLDLLLLPLLGGYLWLTTSTYHRPTLPHLERTRLILTLAVFGLVLLLLARLLVHGTALAIPRTSEQLHALWQRFMPFEQSHTALLTVLLGPVVGRIQAGAWRWRLWWQRRAAGHGWDEAALEVEAVRKVIERNGSRLEQFLMRAVARSVSGDLPEVMLTLSSRKVYVGLIESAPSPDPNVEAFVVLLPTRSGYRDAQTLELHLVKDYSQAWDAVLGELTEDPDEATVQYWSDQLRLYIPVREIVSASYFNPEVHDVLRMPAG